VASRRDRARKGATRDRQTGPARPRLRAARLVAALVVIVVLAWWWTRAPTPAAVERTVASPESRPTRRNDVPAIAYVPNDRCVECHETEAREWASSHHWHAMERATDASVRGDFGGVELTHAGVTSRFSRRDGQFVVRTDGPDGALAEFEVAYTFGVDPLQQYLVGLPGGRMQALTIAWDVERARWFHLYPDEKAPPGDVLHWTGRYQTWNTMCASCHSTNVRKGYDAATDRFATTWSEPNVSCQSCHGPGERHVEWAKNRTGGDRGLRVDFRAGGAGREVDACAPCHARRSELTAAPVPSDALYDDYLPSLLTADLYFPDGQQRGEVYEYGSFRQSKMYQAGVRCTDCHDPHATRLRADGNALCTRCHQTAPDTARFPGLPAKLYDSPAHHFHPAGSPGAQCVACHMPARNYMIVHARRDHAIRIPRPDLSVGLDTPNACTTCHADRDATWAADAVARWYGSGRRQEPGYGAAIAAGRTGRPDAEAVLATLAANVAEPAIVRATALDLLGHYGAASLTASVAAVRDPDPAVRAAAVASLQRVAPDERASLLAPLLDDPARAVRIETARVLASARLSDAMRPRYEAALAEFVAAQNASLDMPGAHLNLAVVYEGRGDAARAEAEYRAALRLDLDFTPARLNLSGLLNRLGRNADAERVLAEGVARVPAEGELQYSLGLLLAEEQRLPEAAAALGRAADLLPNRPRARYNYALALQQLGRRDEAAVAFAAAERADPSDPAIAYAVTVFYAQGNDWTRALAAAERLRGLAPDDPQVGALVDDVRQRASAGRR